MAEMKKESSLWEALQSVPDHRRAAGRRYRLRAVLCIGVAAILAGRTSLAGIARWGRKLNREALRLLGIWRGKSPCHATFHYVFRDLDIAALETALAEWVRGAEGCPEPAQVCVDGKRLRGSRAGECPGVHLLSAYCEAVKGVLGELAVPPESNEITAAMRLLKEIPLEGLVMTGDAIFAQKGICREILERKGDYFFVVKDNQPALKEDIAVAFAPPSSPLGAVRMGA